MCAAPGSKTAQLIEALHVDENIPVPGKYFMSFTVVVDMIQIRC